MASRLDLQKELLEILGSNQVYFQPPESISLDYPCIIYNLNNIEDEKADDRTYTRMRAYTVMVIGRDPDKNTEIAEKILDSFKFTRFDRRYVTDNLYHDAINIYY